MALVNCPECGREKVSDSAESCPSCGYGIRVHFEAIRAKEECKRREEQLRMAAQQRQDLRFKEIKKPEKPIFNRGMFAYITVAVIVLSILFLYLPTTINKSPDVKLFLGELIVFIGIPLAIYLPTYTKSIDDYALAQRDFEAYQKQVIKEQDDRARKEFEKMMNAPKCPHCNSTNIERITTVDRAISIGLTGLASGKIGKQYRCKSCKHMW